MTFPEIVVLSVTQKKVLIAEEWLLTLCLRNNHIVASGA